MFFSHKRSEGQGVDKANKYRHQMEKDIEVHNKNA